MNRPEKDYRLDAIDMLIWFTTIEPDLINNGYSTSAMTRYAILKNCNTLLANIGYKMSPGVGYKRIESLIKINLFEKKEQIVKGRQVDLLKWIPPDDLGKLKKIDHYYSTLTIFNQEWLYISLWLIKCKLAPQLANSKSKLIRVSLIKYRQPHYGRQDVGDKEGGAQDRSILSWRNSYLEHVSRVLALT